MKEDGIVQDFQCPCFKRGKICTDCPMGFEKILDSKAGLVVYRHTKKYEKVNQNIDTSSDLDVDENGFIFHNTKDEDIISKDFIPEMEKRAIKCARCRQIVENAVKILKKVSAISKKEIIGICDHCTLGERPCYECEGALKRFFQSKIEAKEPVFTKDRVRQWLSKVQYKFKGDNFDKQEPDKKRLEEHIEKYKITGKRISRPRSESQIHELCHRKHDRSERELEIRELCHHPSERDVPKPSPVTSDDETNKKQIFFNLDDQVDLVDSTPTLDRNTKSAVPKSKQPLAWVEDQKYATNISKKAKANEKGDRLADEPLPAEFDDDDILPARHPIRHDHDVEAPKLFEEEIDDELRKTKFIFSFPLETKKQKTHQQEKSSFELISDIHDRISKKLEKNRIKKLEEEEKKQRAHLEKNRLAEEKKRSAEEAIHKDYDKYKDIISLGGKESILSRTTQKIKQSKSETDQKDHLKSKSTPGKHELEEMGMEGKDITSDTTLKSKPDFPKRPKADQISSKTDHEYRKGEPGAVSKQKPDSKHHKDETKTQDLKVDKSDVKTKARDQKAESKEPKREPSVQKHLKTEVKDNSSQPKAETKVKSREPKIDQADSKQPKMISMQPKIDTKQLKDDSKQPKGDPKQPKSDSKQSKIYEKQPKIDTKQPKDDLKQPKDDSKQPKIDSKLPKSDAKQSKIDSKQPDFDLKQPKSDAKQSKIDSKQPEINFKQTKAVTKQLKSELKESRIDSKAQRKPRDSEPPQRLPKAALKGASEINVSPSNIKSEPIKSQAMMIGLNKSKTPKIDPNQPKGESKANRPASKKPETDSKSKSGADVPYGPKKTKDEFEDVKVKEISTSPKDIITSFLRKPKDDESKQKRGKETKAPDVDESRIPRRQLEAAKAALSKEDTPKFKKQKKELTTSKIKMMQPSQNYMVLDLVKVKGVIQRTVSKIMTPSQILCHETDHRILKPGGCPMCIDSNLELEYESGKKKPLIEQEEMIKGRKIARVHAHAAHFKHHEHEDVKPLLFQLKYDNKFHAEIIEPPKYIPAIKENLEKETQTKNLQEEGSKGVIRYALSDRSFIEKVWTLLPTEKVVRKMNVYRMRPAHPEFDWFEHNKNKRLMSYDTGERLAEFDDDGRGRWYYRNQRLALQYYDAEELNAQQRFVIYSNGEPDERGRTRPYTILATFDYLGNGIVFDHGGKIRMKYNQTEGVILDRNIGPVSHWKWHTLNDPPVLQQVMIDTHMSYKDPQILKMSPAHDKQRRPDNEEMLAIEFDNFIKEKSKKLSQTFKPFQIKMKALKINENFSLKVMDQANVYLIYRDGTTNIKLNLGMLLDHKEIVDTDTAEVGEVASNMERLPAKTDSLAAMQKSVAYAQQFERSRTERDRRLQPPAVTVSADKITAAASRPTRLPLVAAYSSTTTSYPRSRKPSSNNVYYDSRLF